MVRLRGRRWRVEEEEEEGEGVREIKRRLEVEVLGRGRARLVINEVLKLVNELDHLQHIIFIPSPLSHQFHWIPNIDERSDEESPVGAGVEAGGEGIDELSSNSCMTAVVI
jgi:hypothetical protein